MEPETTALGRLGGAAARHPWRVLGLWGGAAVLTVVAAATAGGTLAEDWSIPGSDSTAAADLLSEHFPAFAGTSATVVVHDEPAAPADGVAAVRDAVADLPHVTMVGEPRVSPDGTTAVLDVSYDVPVTDLDLPSTVAALDEAAEPLREAGATVELGGEVVDNDIEPGGTAEGVGILAALVLLLLVFGSIVAAGLPVAVALVSIGVGLSVVTVLANYVQVSTNVPTLAAMLGIGVGVDYALFLLARHRQNLLDGVPVVPSITRTVATSGRAVLFAGGTVLLSISGLAFVGVPNFVLMGLGTGLVVAIAAVAAVTLMPALLALAGPRVLGRRTRRALAAGEPVRPEPAREPTAERWARHTARHPVLYAVGGVAVLLALAVPALSLNTGLPDASTASSDTTQRRAYELVSTAFGPGATAPLVLAVDTTEPGGDPAALAAMASELPGVLAVSPPVPSPDGTAAVLTVTPRTGAADAATQDLVDDLRTALPDAAHVTGPTASFLDFDDRLSDRLPFVVALVVGASLLLLTLVFRSVVVPVKAAVLNLLSVGAAYGVLVAVFQWGWGSAIPGLPEAAPVPAFVPVLLFAVLFGLSMDYEVFLLSRVREEFDRTGDPRGSVVRGLGATARVISAAAAIMATVFAAFALNPAVPIKMMGLGMAAAVLLDATLVRLVLVPATMVLLGKANWWLPGWLDRVLPRLAVEGPPDDEGTAAGDRGVVVPEPRTARAPDPVA